MVSACSYRIQGAQKRLHCVQQCPVDGNVATFLLFTILENFYTYLKKTARKDVFAAQTSQIASMSDCLFIKGYIIFHCDAYLSTFWFIIIYCFVFLVNDADWELLGQLGNFYIIGLKHM